MISVRRNRMLGELNQVRAVAEVAQRVLLRPPQPTIGDVMVAARSASASAGASVGGDFYDIVDTPYGVRAIIGDVRGSGLGAVEVAAVLLGSFREAAYDEPDLRDLVRRLEISLRRYLGDADAAAAHVAARGRWRALGNIELARGGAAPDNGGCARGVRQRRRGVDPAGRLAGARELRARAAADGPLRRGVDGAGAVGRAAAGSEHLGTGRGPAGRGWW